MSAEISRVCWGIEWATAELEELNVQVRKCFEETRIVLPRVGIANDYEVWGSAPFRHAAIRIATVPTISDQLDFFRVRSKICEELSAFA